MIKIVWNFPENLILSLYYYVSDLFDYATDFF